MKLAMDVQYHLRHAIGAAIGFVAWTDEVASYTDTVRVPLEADYEPGQLYKRELPALVALLGNVREPPEVVLVDAYVDLDGDRPGLGRRLHQLTGIPVIGIAKTRFAGAPAIEVLRGGSRRPLFVSAAGMDAEEAARHVLDMHGNARLPTLISATDRLARHG
jgi:deoxyribonuclease V